MQHSEKMPLLLHTAYKLRELCCVSLGPLSGYPVMFCSVGQILSGYASNQRIRWKGEKNNKKYTCLKGTVLTVYSTET